jgi:hypothetical protein
LVGTTGDGALLSSWSDQLAASELLSTANCELRCLASLDLVVTSVTGVKAGDKLRALRGLRMLAKSDENGLLFIETEVSSTMTVGGGQCDASQLRRGRSQ